MSAFTERLNFSIFENLASESAIKLHNRNRDIGYYYDNLCLYCANNNVNIDSVSDNEFMHAAKIMESFSTTNNSIDNYFFWIS